MNNNTLAIVIGAVVIIGLGIWLIGSNREAAEPAGTTQNVNVQATTTQAGGTTATSSQGVGAGVSGSVNVGTVKEFTVTASNFSFAPVAMTVNQGDRVRIVFKNSNGTHDFVLDEFGVNSGILQAGQEKVLEFTATQTGSFEYYCSVGQHREMGMKGTLTVR